MEASKLNDYNDEIMEEIMARMISFGVSGVNGFPVHVEVFGINGMPPAKS